MSDEMPELDFGRFHAIGDHWPFTRYCRTQYKGGWHHLKIAWMFRYREPVMGLLWYRWAHCARGRHDWRIMKRGGRWWRPRGTDLQQPTDYLAICTYCPANRPATEDEWW